MASLTPKNTLSGSDRLALAKNAFPAPKSVPDRLLRDSGLGQQTKKHSFCFFFGCRYHYPCRCCEYCYYYHHLLYDDGDYYYHCYY